MLRTLDSIQGYRVSARGELVGHLVDAYFDDGDWRVRYFVAQTGETSSRQGLWFSPAVVKRPDDSAAELGVTLSGEQLDQTSLTNADRPDSDPAWAHLHDDHGWPHYWLAPILRREDGPIAFTDPAGPPPAAEARSDVDPHLRSANEIRGYTIEGRDGKAGRVSGLLCEDDDWRVRYVVGVQDPEHDRDLYIDPRRITNVERERSVVHVDMSVDAIHETSQHEAPRGD